MCTRYKDRIIGQINFSSKWIEGADSVHTTNICDHTAPEQHIHAMNLERKRLAVSVDEIPASYGLIVRALTTISPEEMERLRVKFDVAYFIAKENIAFTKYSKICALEERHGVKVGSNYLTNNAAKDFVHFIARSMKTDDVSEVSRAKFFSIFLDGSTDKGNVDNELMMVCWCDTNAEDKKLYTRIGFLAMTGQLQQMLRLCTNHYSMGFSSLASMTLTKMIVAVLLGLLLMVLQ